MQCISTTITNNQEPPKKLDHHIPYQRAARQQSNQHYSETSKPKSQDSFTIIVREHFFFCLLRRMRSGGARMVWHACIVVATITQAYSIEFIRAFSASSAIFSIAMKLWTKKKWLLFLVLLLLVSSIEPITDNPWQRAEKKGRDHRVLSAAVNVCAIISN